MGWATAHGIQRRAPWIADCRQISGNSRAWLSWGAQAQVLGEALPAQKICSATPQGRMTSVGSSFGLIGGETGSLQQVVNYNTGEVSNFATGGVQAGWNGCASASASVGFVYRPSGQFNNSDFSGPFNNVSVSASQGPGGSASWASNSVKVVSGSVSATLIPRATANYSYTWTSNPLPAGSIWTNLSNPLGLADVALYGLRPLCN